MKLLFRVTERGRHVQLDSSVGREWDRQESRTASTVIGRDGNCWWARSTSFVDLQQSDICYASTPDLAYDGLQWLEYYRAYQEKLSAYTQAQALLLASQENFTGIDREVGNYKEKIAKHMNQRPEYVPQPKELK